MPNMSYCKFENTFNDLQDCFDGWDECSSESEKKYRERMKELIAEMAENLCDMDAAQ